MIVYICKSSLSLIILFGLYWFLLRKEKLFIFNRFFLIFAVVFSLALPFISIPVNFQTTPKLENIIPTYYNVITEISSSDIIIPQDVNINQPYVGQQPSPIDISEFLLALYISGVILFLIRFMRNIYLIIRKIKLSEKISLEGYRIVLTNDDTSPYCFLRSLFLNREDYLNGRIDEELFNHELEHVRQSHTIDIILIELVKIFYWFNPIHLLYDRAIRLNHEYLADNCVINDNYNIKSYSDKLLSFTTGKSNMSLTSGSNHSFTKMRLMMMMKSKSRSFIYGARITMTICIGTIFFMLLSFKESEKQPIQPDLSETGTEMAQNTVRGIVLSEDGRPLEEVFIMSTGTMGNAMLATTGQYGKFSINNIQANVSLMFSCKGYISQTIKAADLKTDVIIKMAKDLASESGSNAVPPKIFPNRTLNVILGPDNKIYWYPGLVREEQSNNLPSLREVRFGPDGIRQMLLDRNITLARKINAFTNDVLSGKILIPKDSAQKVINSMKSTDNTGPIVLIKAYEGAKYRNFVDIQDEMNICGIAQYMFVDIAWYEEEMVKKAIAASESIAASPPPPPLTEEEAEPEPFIVVEEMPMFPGGQSALLMYIGENTNYPDVAKENNIQGDVIVRFVVNIDGTVDRTSILKGVDPILDEEAIRIINSLPTFTPGKHGSKPVPVWYMIPVNFSLPKDYPASRDNRSNSNTSNIENGWWTPILQKHNIDLAQFPYKNNFFYGSSDSTGDKALIIGKNPMNISKPDNKLPILNIEEPILIIKEKNGYNLLIAKSAIQDSENNQITCENGTMETFIDGDEWMDSPEFASYMKPGKSITFEKLILNSKTRRVIVKTVNLILE